MFAMVREAEARCAIRLSDAVQTTRTEDSEGGEGAPVKEVRPNERQECGFRFQQCGGGRRIIKRQRGRNY